MTITFRPAIRENVGVLAGPNDVCNRCIAKAMNGFGWIWPGGYRPERKSR